MKAKMLAIGLMSLVLPLLAATGDDPAMKLAKEVVHASGGDDWGNVSSVAFTFNVEKDGKVGMSAKHVWDVRANTDTVTWDGKTVTVHLGEKNLDGDAKAAFGRWTNDSYWLLSPLKLLDGGVKLEHGGTQEIEGAKYEVLRASFENVGLTPNDKYNFYIDPQSHMVRRWDYMPSADKKVSGTWDGYKKFGPLTLSTEHEFSGRRIFFTDVEVKTDR